MAFVVSGVDLEPILARAADMIDRGDHQGALAVLDATPAAARGAPAYRYVRASALVRAISEPKKLSEGVRLLEGLDRAGKLDAGARSMLGNALKIQGAHAKAIRHLARAAKEAPDTPGVQSNLAAAHYEAADWAEAERWFRRAIARSPSDLRARRGLGHIRLGLSDFEEGWALYAARLEIAPKPTPPAGLEGIAAWTGDALDGRRLALWREQGVGEELLFGSLAPEMAARAAAEGGALGLVVDPRLAGLFSRATPEAEILAGDATAAVAPFDLQAPMGALGPALRPNRSAFPPPKPYLAADAARRAEMRAWLEAFPKPWVGISWRSKLTRAADKKSIPLDLWKPILAGVDATFVDLQYGDAAEDRALAKKKLGVEIRAHPTLDKRDDLDGLAALIAELDAVATISNATAHLAGALGAKTVLMLGASHFWYWRHGGEADGLWYPNQRVVRAQDGGRWPPVLEAAATALRAALDA